MHPIIIVRVRICLNDTASFTFKPSVAPAFPSSLNRIKNLKKFKVYIVPLF